MNNRALQFDHNYRTVHGVISHRVIFALLHLLTSLPCLKFTQTQSFYKIDDSVNSSNLKFAN